MPQVDPKFTFWFGVWTNVLMLVAGLGVDHAPPLIAQYAPDVQWVCSVFYKVNSVVLTALTGISSTQSGPLISVPTGAIKPIIILAILVGGLFAFAGDARAAQPIPRPRPPAVTGNPIADIKTDLGIAPSAPAGPTVSSTGVACDPARLLPGCAAPSAAASAALPCMDMTMLPKLTLLNLMPTMKACVQDLNGQLVTDTQRALDSAKAFTGSATGSGTGTASGTVIGDNDAINCLTPALALFKAAMIIPAVAAVPAVDAVAAQPAVLNLDGSLKTPAVAAVAAVPAVAGSPEVDPGPILLGQKFREFTLAGGITSCQAWVNEPVQAVNAAAAGGVAAVAGAALLLPK
jgi:hypothetical protein